MWQNSKIVPKIPTPWCTCLYNCLPLSTGRACESDGISPPWLDYSSVDFELIKGENVLGGTGLIR